MNVSMPFFLRAGESVPAGLSEVALVGLAVLNIVWMFVTTLYALRYVRRAQEQERRGEDLEAALKEQRGKLDLVLVVRPAWRVFARLAGGAPIETCVEDVEEVPFDKLVERAAGGLQRATMVPPSKSGRFHLPPSGAFPRELPRPEDILSELEHEPWMPGSPR